MDDLALRILWITSLTLPALVFFAFRSHRWSTDVIAAAVGVVSGWLLNIAYVVAAQAITIRDPSEVNGAASAFGLVLGWVLPSILVILTWIARYVITRRTGHAKIR